jgi:hypothetical protein
MYILRLREVVGERCLKEWWRRCSIYLVGGWVGNPSQI